MNTQLPLIAIAGNPNVGKTSIFNQLTGADLKVGNYPGITVERSEATVTLEGFSRARIVDIPGTYSLSARSSEEQIALQSIAGLPPLDQPDLIVLVADATQLTRNLYLVLQVLEIGIPTIIALNMVDLSEKRGYQINSVGLSNLLGVPVVPVQGNRGVGINLLRRTMHRTMQKPQDAIADWQWRPRSPELIDDMRYCAETFPESWTHSDFRRADALALWALLSIDPRDELQNIPAELRKRVNERRVIASDQGREIVMEGIQSRYDWIDDHCHEFVQRCHQKPGKSERLDSWLLSPAFGFVIFLMVMGLLFQALFSWSGPAIAGIETAFAGLASLVQSTLPPSFFREFLTNGLIAGVGSVLVFLPQILLLFFFIGLMEDTGYMARVAYIMDRVMKMIGLHGRAFVPMLSGFACAVPAIMATRTMERRRDRLLTMMVIPLMTCSARLPVYTLIIAALIPPMKIWGLLPVQSMLMIAMYLFSTVVALIAAAILGRTIFKGPRIPLILELPPYRIPHWMSVLKMMWHRGLIFLREAGSIILICTILLWILLSFPRHPKLETDFEALRVQATEQAVSGEDLQERLHLIEHQETAAIVSHSYAGRLGRLIEPVLQPLGMDWKIGVGLIGAFAAREVFISTMGIVYGLGEHADEQSTTLRQKIRAEIREDGKPLYTPLMGLSLMIFFALSCQCMGTLAAVRRETQSWGWPAFLFAYMTSLAWIASFIVYQGGKLLGWE